MSASNDREKKQEIFYQNISAAERYCKVDASYAVSTNHGKLMRLIKKVIYKIVRWSLRPNLNMQEMYNESMIRAVCSVDASDTELTSLRKRIEMLEQKVDYLKKENDSLKKKLEH